MRKVPQVFSRESLKRKADSGDEIHEKEAQETVHEAARELRGKSEEADNPPVFAGFDFIPIDKEGFEGFGFEVEKEKDSGMNNGDSPDEVGEVEPA